MFPCLDIVSDTAVSYCRERSSQASSFDVSQAKHTACPLPSLPSLAMNFITTVSTQPRLSGSIDTWRSSENKLPEQVLTVTDSAASSTPESFTPKARGKRRSSQSKTSYHLAHPPPRVRHRRHFQFRPKTLLQLQQLSSTSRPTPVLDVLPSVLFAPRLARKVPLILQRRQGLGLDDLVVVQSQTREPVIAAESEPSEYVDEEKATETTIVAAICQSPSTASNGQSRTEIRLNNDSAWRATALSNGAYEFVSSGPGEIQSIARWVPKRNTGTGGSTGQAAQNFKFSLIDTHTRRHPVIANMNRQSIDVYDRYSVPSSPQDICRHTDVESIESMASDRNLGTKDGQCEEPCKATVETDDHLRTIITVTGIWVAFCEGWSPNFRYSTTQVISNGISELSNRRRSSAANPSSSPKDAARHEQPQSNARAQYRPGVLQTSSFSSVPSSPSQGLPTAFPRRTASMSTTLPGDDKCQHCACSGMDRQPSPIISDSGNDTGHGKPVNALGIDALLAATPTFGFVGQQDSVRRHQGVPMSNREATFTEGLAKRPGRFKNLFKSLRRTSGVH